MSKQLAQQPIKTAQANQTPFARLQAAMSTVLSVPKSSLPMPSARKSAKKPRKKPSRA